MFPFINRTITRFQVTTTSVYIGTGKILYFLIKKVTMNTPPYFSSPNYNMYSGWSIPFHRYFFVAPLDSSKGQDWVCVTEWIISWSWFEHSLPLTKATIQVLPFYWENHCSPSRNGKCTDINWISPKRNKPLLGEDLLGLNPDLLGPLWDSSLLGRGGAIADPWLFPKSGTTWFRKGTLPHCFPSLLVWSRSRQSNNYCFLLLPQTLWVVPSWAGGRGFPGFPLSSPLVSWGQ